MYANPPKPGWYLSHINPKALAEHRPTLYWDSEYWCGDNSPNRDVQAVQKRYWARLEGGTIYISLGHRSG